MPSDKMIFIADIPESLISFLGLQQKQIKIFRSKGLLAHLLKRKHYKAAKYLDFIPEIINAPDYCILRLALEWLKKEDVDKIKEFSGKPFFSIF